MSAEISVLPPTFYMPKKLKDHLRHISEKVARNAAEKAYGRDLILEIYLAGFYHGVKMVERANEKEPTK